MELNFMLPSSTVIKTVHITNLAHKLLCTPSCFVIVKLIFTVECLLTPLTFGSFRHSWDWFFVAEMVRRRVPVTIGAWFCATVLTCRIYSKQGLRRCVSHLFRRFESVLVGFSNMDLQSISRLENCITLVTLEFSFLNQGLLIGFQVSLRNWSRFGFLGQKFLPAPGFLWWRDLPSSPWAQILFLYWCPGRKRRCCQWWGRTWRPCLGCSALGRGPCTGKPGRSHFHPQEPFLLLTSELAKEVQEQECKTCCHWCNSESVDICNSCDVLVENSEDENKQARKARRYDGVTINHSLTHWPTDWQG